jgi:hypothetical protein
MGGIEWLESGEEILLKFLVILEPKVKPEAATAYLTTKRLVIRAKKSFDSYHYDLIRDIELEEWKDRKIINMRHVRPISIAVQVSRGWNSDRTLELYNWLSDIHKKARPLADVLKEIRENKTFRPTVQDPMLSGLNDIKLTDPHTWLYQKDLEKAENSIKVAWEAAGLVAVITFLALLANLAGFNIGDMNLWSLIDVAFASLLAFGIYRKSRTCAVLMFLYYLLSKVITIVESPKTIGGSIFLSLFFVWAFLNGIRGTFTYHKLTPEKERVKAPKIIIISVVGIVVLISIILLIGYFLA